MGVDFSFDTCQIAMSEEELRKYDTDFLIRLAGKLLICKEAAMLNLNLIGKILTERGIFDANTSAN